MKISTLILLLSSLFISSLKAIPTTWIGGNGDWDIAANWDTGLVPQYNDRITIGSGVIVTIPSSSFAKAKTLFIDSGSELIIESGAELKLKDAVLSNLGTSLENHGTINIDGLLVVKHNTGANYSSILNYNTVNVNSTGELRIFDFEGNAIKMLGGNSKLINRGITHIYEGNEGIVVTDGRFINHDSLSFNQMDIAMINYDLMRNYGKIDITESENGISNTYQFFNQFRGDIYISDTENQGIVNAGDPLNNLGRKFINFGDIYIDNCDGYPMYHINFENFINKPAGDIEITNSSGGINQLGIAASENYGNIIFDQTSYAISLSSESSFVNQNGGSISMHENTSYSIRMLDDTKFDNYGALIFEDSYHGIELMDYSYFDNHPSGTILAEACPVAVFSNDSDTFFSNLGLLDIKYASYGIYMADGASASLGGDCVFIDNGSGIAVLDGSSVTIISNAEFNGNDYGINVNGYVLVYDNAVVQNYDRIAGSPTGKITNTGIFLDDYSGSHGNIIFWNKGVVLDHFENGAWDSPNYSYIIKPWNNVQNGVIVPDALHQGTTTYTNILGIYTDELSLVSAGVYDVNTDEFLPNINAVGLTSLYVLAENIATGVSSYFEIPIEGGVLPFKNKTKFKIASRMNDSNAEEIKIFPNPTIADITMKIPDHIAGEINIVIVNLMGQVVENQSINASENELIQLLVDPNIPTGSYMLSVADKYETIYKTQIIKH